MRAAGARHCGVWSRGDRCGLLPKSTLSSSTLTSVIRRLGVTEQTYYRWKAKFGGMEVSDAKKLKALEDENRRLKQMVADQALDIQALKAVVAKKW